MAENSPAPGAVFLSYASQDAAAAQRLCAALRSAGVEVWFDQSELVGGDAWDQKIRRQISACALFVPVISANTQARLEGYFRLEWKLAAQRTHTMADEKTFLLPVVIDDTRDAEAKVPGEFKAVQWTRLPPMDYGAANPREHEEPALVKFIARVQKLLAGEAPSAKSEGPEHRPKNLAPSTQNLKPTGKAYAGLALGAMMVAAGATWFMLKSRRNPEDNAPRMGDAQAIAAKVSVSAIAPSPSDAVLTRVQATLAKLDVTRAELDLASDLMARAAQADPTNARVCATWASVDFRYINDYYDASDTRRDALARHMAQAMGLDPADPEVRLARAITLVSGNNDKVTRDQSREMLEVLQRELPQDWRVYHSLGWRTEDPAAAEAWWDRQAALPGQAATVAFNRAFRLIYSHDLRAGYPALDAALKREKSTKGLLWKAYLEVVWLGDVATAQKTMAQVPAAEFVEDMAGSARSFVAFWARDFQGALAAAQAIPRDFVSSGAGALPTGYTRGLALQQLGRKAAAENEWRAALATTERRLRTEPNDWTLLMSKAVLVALLGDKAAGAELWRTARELHGPNPNIWLEDDVALTVLPAEEVIARLEGLVRGHQGWFAAAVLRLNPNYDGIRNHPRFVALQAEADADPKLSPTAPDHAPSTSHVAPPNPAQPDAKSVAVLAFTNLSDDKANEYFSDGISEELLNVLAKVQGLKVSARTSAFYFKGKEVPVPEIAKQLGVAYVVEGSVRKQGEKVRITAQLIKAADGFHVWSDTFTRDLKDIFAVQDEIAGLIARQLQLTLGESTRAKKAVNPEAHQLVLEARFFWTQRNETALARAEAACQRALEIDAGFAPAHAGLADVWAIRGWYRNMAGNSEGAKSDLARARTEIRQAQDLDPLLAEPWASLGIVEFNDGNFEASERNFGRALELNPSYAVARHWHAVLLSCRGRKEESFREIGRSIALDPLSPNALWSSATNRRVAGRIAEALDACEQALALRPGHLPVLAEKTTVLWQLGRMDEAAEVARAMGRDLNQEPRWFADASAVFVLRATGHADEAEAYAQRFLAKLSATDYRRGFVLAALGRVNEAFQSLSSSVIPTTAPYTLYWDPYWDDMRDDPRFAELLARLGCAKEYELARAGFGRPPPSSGPGK